MLGDERRRQISERVRRVLAALDPEVQFLDVVLDSTRTQLALVLQKGEWPIVLGIDYLDYVSHGDEELSQRLAEGLQQRLKAAQERLAAEAE